MSRFSIAYPTRHNPMTRRAADWYQLIICSEASVVVVVPTIFIGGLPFNSSPVRPRPIVWRIGVDDIITD